MGGGEGGGEFRILKLRQKGTHRVQLKEFPSLAGRVGLVQDKFFSCLGLSSRSVTREYFPYTLKLSPSPIFAELQYFVLFAALFHLPSFLKRILAVMAGTILYQENPLHPICIYYPGVGSFFWKKKSREEQFVDKNVKYIQVMLKKSYLPSFDLLVPLIQVLLFSSTFEY